VQKRLQELGPEERKIINVVARGRSGVEQLSI